MRSNVNRHEGGFTLVEMAMVTIFIGIVVAAAAPLYSAHMKKKAMERTQQNIETISTAIGNFRTLYGRYPCPASLTDQRGSVEYGHEPRAPGRPPCADTTPVLGTCANGVCIQQSIAARDLDPDPAVTDRPRVRLGWVPFRELGIPEDAAFDPYGNRLSYAVTERLAVDTTFAVDQGGIEILNEQNQTALGAGAGGSAHFMLFSHGRNGAGAYTKEGVQLPCPPAGDFEEMNSTCAVAPGAAEASFRMVRGDESFNNSRFDDQVTYFTKEEVPLWQTSTLDPNAIHVKTSGEVGVYASAGSDVPTDFFSVGGDIQIDDDPATAAAGQDEGRLITTEIRDPLALPAQLGYSAAKIAGVPANGGGMRCPGSDPDGAGAYMVAVRDGGLVCEDDPPIAMCPPGEVVVGMQADGTLICSGPPVQCPATVVNDCAGNSATPPLMLPVASAGATAGIASGISMIRTYRCRSDGTWRYQSSTGNCNCLPRPDQVTTPSCGTGYTGNRVVTRRWDCTNGYGQWVTVSTDSSACVCNAATPPQTDQWDCPDGFNDGDIVARRDWSCSPPGWSAWYEQSNTCQCLPTSQNSTYACTGNLTGTGRVERRDFICPGGAGSPGSWQSPVVVSNDCNCVSGREQTWTDDTACPTGETGSITYRRVLGCPAATWGPPIEVSRDCTPQPPSTCEWMAGGQGTFGQTNGFGAEVGEPCTCGSTPPGPCHEGSDPSVTNYNRCSCQ